MLWPRKPGPSTGAFVRVASGHGLGVHWTRAMNVIRGIVVYVLLIGMYSLTWLVAVLCGKLPRRSWKPTGRIMVIGTFHNPNWYLSHLTPLSRSGVTEVIVVTDRPQSPLERVKFACPPGWMARLLGRAGAKGILLLVTGLRLRADLYVGYHLMPGACSALMIGRLLGRPSCYQMTGGPTEVVGGGYGAVDSLEGALARPSKLIEALALGVVRQFDLVVVRGHQAKEFLQSRNVRESVAIITGSVNGRNVPEMDRDIDLIYVGRLSTIKQVDQFIAIVNAVRRAMPTVHAAVVGDGPLKMELQELSQELGLSANLEFLGKRKDVESLLARSKVLALTSKSEGLSIAMAEAMTSGVVPVVADIGELGDLVVDGVNGHLVEPNNVSAHAAKVVSLLQDHALRMQFSLKAAEAARSYCDIDVVSRRWRQHLHDVVSRASRRIPREVLT